MAIVLPGDGGTDLRIVLDPYPTVLALIADAGAGGVLGTPPRWLNQVSALLPPDARRVLAPLTTLPRHAAPDCLLPVHPVRDGEISDVPARLRAVPPGDLAASVRRLGDAPSASRWQRATADPDAWLAVLATSADAVVTGCRDLWRQAGGMFAREIDKLGGVLLRDGVAAAIRSAHPRYLACDGRLDIAGAELPSGDVSCRGLTLVPMLCGTHGTLFNVAGPDSVWLGYPASGIVAGTRSGTPANNGLTALLGPARARILRLLDREFTMHEIASQVYITPATATYHCSWLEKQNLIFRERMKSAVQVIRTPRGEELLRLFPAE